MFCYFHWPPIFRCIDQESSSPIQNTPTILKTQYPSALSMQLNTGSPARYRRSIAQKYLPPKQHRSLALNTLVKKLRVSTGNIIKCLLENIIMTEQCSNTVVGTCTLLHCIAECRRQARNRRGCQSCAVSGTLQSAMHAGQNKQFLLAS